MFYEQLVSALNGNRSNGWMCGASLLSMTVDELMSHIEKEDLTFEQSMRLTKGLQCPELLIYVFSLFDESFGFRHHTQQPFAKSVSQQNQNIWLQ